MVGAQDVDELDGTLQDEDVDDSFDELLQQHLERGAGPDGDLADGYVPSWKAVLKNTDICNRCNKKVGDKCHCIFLQRLIHSSSKS